jgi:hypothetical protein
MVELRSGMGAHLLGEKRRRRGRRAEEGVVIRQLVHLPGDSIGDFGAAIADIHAPEAGKSIQILAPFGIENIDTLAALDDAGAIGVELAHISERMEVMGGIEGGEIGAAWCIGHAYFEPSLNLHLSGKSFNAAIMCPASHPSPT